jgi:hypothetical protein
MVETHHGRLHRDGPRRDVDEDEEHLCGMMCQRYLGFSDARRII